MPKFQNLNPGVTIWKISGALRGLAAILLFLVMWFSSSYSIAGEDPLRKSLVKIFTTIEGPNFNEPWRMDPREDVSGSGSILPGNRILTNAHVVADQVFIQVLKDGDTKKYTAKIVAVANDCDLAVLQVDDSRFFKGTKPVTFGDLTALRDKVSVYGYPVGGSDLSITEGVVSRIELVTYSHSLRTLLGVQTDAAINPGNSGGPVFKNKKLVGVAFQGYNAAVAQNTGFFIPTMLVKRFLNEIKSGGAYQGIPALGLYVEPLENETLRAYYGMKGSQVGALVSKVVYGSGAWGIVQEDDVVLSIDGYSIADDGSIPFRKGERLNFQYPLCLHRIGDKIKLKILRNHKPLTVTVPLKEEARLVPFPRYDRKPSYFIFDGIIFSELDTDYIRSLKDADQLFYALYFSGLPSPEQKSVVVINHILPHEINKGYGSEYSNLIVTKINGVSISEMKDVIKALQKPVGGLHVIEFDKYKEVGTRIVLKAEGSEKATQEILTQNNIPSDRSPDLK